ncbi:MAG: hypothetical protein OXU62_10225 [Gammaproteobacteria bacterium]|nr:hypothetical protein [Gammaproteobacteria bacterium]
MKPPSSSNAFALPIAVSVFPPRRIAAVVVALHCLPLPLLVVALPGAWLAAALATVAASLALSLRRQSRAANAARLLTTAGNQWRLHRRGAGTDGDRGAGVDGVDGDRDAGIDGDRDPGENIELIDGANCGRFILLLATQHNRRFHLAIDSRAQPHDQSHRLRVWLAHRNPSADPKPPWRP